MKLEDEKFVWFDHPVGFHLYMREEVNGERRERPVFGQQASASFHSAEQMDDPRNDVEKLRDRFISVLWCIQEERMAVLDDNEERVNACAQVRHMLHKDLEFREQVLVKSILSQMNRTPGVDIGVPEIDELVRLAHEKADVGDLDSLKNEAEVSKKQKKIGENE